MSLTAVCLVCYSSGAREVSPTPVPTVLVAETPATTKMPKLLGGLLAKKTLNTFPTPEATPAETPAPDTPTLKELLLKVRNFAYLHSHDESITDICRMCSKVAVNLY